MTASAATTALLLAGLALLPHSAEAGAQWKWRDASGAIQYSDRPPPPGTPEANILSRPTGTRLQLRKPQDAAAAASAPALKASATQPSEDPELEARRKKAEAEEAAKKKAEEEKMAKQKAENCQRARSYQKTLQDGIRIMRTNAQGEREVLDDKGRGEELRRAQESIQNNCN